MVRTTWTTTKESRWATVYFVYVRLGSEILTAFDSCLFNVFVRYLACVVLICQHGFGSRDFSGVVPLQPMACWLLLPVVPRRAVKSLALKGTGVYGPGMCTTVASRVL